MLNDTEVLAITPSTASRLAILPLRPSKFTPCNIRVQVGVNFILSTLCSASISIVSLPTFFLFVIACYWNRKTDLINFFG